MNRRKVLLVCTWIFLLFPIPSFLMTMSVSAARRRRPTANFLASPRSGPEPLTVWFTDTSTSRDGITAWEWDFENDGVVDSGEQNPIHVYGQDGAYTVTLWVYEDDGHRDVETKLRYVKVTDTEPHAYFDATPTGGLEPLVVGFTDTSTSYDEIVSWIWHFGDGETSTLQNPIHEYPVYDVFSVTLTVEEADRSTDTITKQVSLLDVAPPEADDDYDGLWHSSDFTITLTATDDLSGVAEIYYRVNYGPIQNVGSGGQPLITSESANNTLEYWSVDNAGNEEPHHIVRDIKLDKTSPIAVAGLDREVDEDTPVAFDGSTSYDNIGIVDYTWVFFDRTLQTLTGEKPLYTFHAPGEYTVNLTVVDAALNYASDTVLVTVIDVTRPIANAGDDQVVHEDTAVVLDGSASVDNVEIVSYVWSFIDVAPQTLFGANPTYIFDRPGVYNVTLTVSDAQGNSAIDVVTVTVIDASWPAAEAGPDQIVDENASVSFDGSASSDNVGIVSYVWTFMDGTLQMLFGVNPSYTFQKPGVYTVTLNVTDAEEHFTTDTVVITVRDITPPIIGLGDYVLVVENAPVSFDASGSYDNVGIINYQWDFGDGAFENSTIPSVIHIYSEPGAYTVLLTVVDKSGNVNSASMSIAVHRDTDGDYLADYLDSDDDNDGLPDDWEIIHVLDPLNPSDASLDPDGDGLNNRTEYQRNSDPNVYTGSPPLKLLIALMTTTAGFIFSGVLFMRVRRRRNNSEKTRQIKA